MNTRKRLEKIADSLRKARDLQEEIPCREGDCLCNEFDIAIDKVEDLRNKFVEVGA